MVLNKAFEASRHIDEDGVEFWFARELMSILGYDKWQNFDITIERAKRSCKNSGKLVEEEFLLTPVKTLDEGGRPLKDYILSRYACYLIAQNGDPRKPEIATAQTYFAIQTRKQEIKNISEEQVQRLKARGELTTSEKEFGGLLFEKGFDGKEIATVKSEGDKALFKRSTKEMKLRLKVPLSRPLADFLPTVVISAKSFATSLTNHFIKQKDPNSKRLIQTNHVGNNLEVRKVLLEKGVIPEESPPEEDLKKLEAKAKRSLKNSIKKCPK